MGRALEGQELSTEGSAQGVSNEDPTYRLLVDCNQLSVDIDGEIAIVHNFMKVRHPLNEHVPPCLAMLCSKFSSLGSLQVHRLGWLQAQAGH